MFIKLCIGLEVVRSETSIPGSCEANEIFPSYNIYHPNIDALIYDKPRPRLVFHALVCLFVIWSRSSIQVRMKPAMANSPLPAYTHEHHRISPADLIRECLQPLKAYSKFLPCLAIGSDGWSKAPPASCQFRHLKRAGNNGLFLALWRILHQPPLWYLLL